MGAHAAKINDRNDQLSLLQDDGWTATDKRAQLSPLEVWRENRNPSRLYQLPAVISRVVRVLQFALSQGPWEQEHALSHRIIRQMQNIHMCTQPCQIVCKGHKMFVNSLKRQVDHQDSLESQFFKSLQQILPRIRLAACEKCRATPTGVLPNPSQTKFIFPHVVLEWFGDDHGSPVCILRVLLCRSLRNPIPDCRGRDLGCRAAFQLLRQDSVPYYICLTSLLRMGGDLLNVRQPLLVNHLVYP